MEQGRPATGTERHALVTGASRGVGRAVAEALVARGLRVWAVGRDAAALADLAGRSAHAGAGGIEPLVADLTDDGALRAVVERFRTVAPALEVLVHAAGIAHIDSLDEEIGEAFAEHAAINVIAPMRLTAALLDDLRVAHGLVVVVNSAAALRSAGGFAAYASSKGALRSWTDALRADLAGHGVRVSSVFPGQVATDMQAAIYAAQGGDYHPEVLLQPADVADLVGFLVDHPTMELTEVSLRSATAGYRPHST